MTIEINKPQITQDFIKGLAKLIGEIYERQTKDKSESTHKILHK